VTRPVTECLCFELRDYFDDDVLHTSECLKVIGVAYAARMQNMKYQT